MITMNRFFSPFFSHTISVGMATLLFVKSNGMLHSQNSRQVKSETPRHLQCDLVFSTKTSDVTNRLAIANGSLYRSTTRGVVQAFRIKSGSSTSPWIQSKISLPVDCPWVISPDGSSLAVAASEPQGVDGLREVCPIKIWNLSNLRLRSKHVYSRLSNVCFSPGGTNLYALNTSGDPGESLAIIDLKNGSQRFVKSSASAGDVAVMSSDGNLIVSQFLSDVGVDLSFLNLKTRSYRINDITRAFVNWKMLHKTTPEPLFVSPKNGFVWVQNVALPIRQDLSTGKAVFRLPSEQERALWMDKRGRILTINFKAKTFRLWNVQQGRVEAQSALVDVKPQATEEQLPISQQTLTAASTDGHFVAVSQEGKLQVWRLNLSQ